MTRQEYKHPTIYGGFQEGYARWWGEPMPTSTSAMDAAANLSKALGESFYVYEGNGGFAANQKDRINHHLKELVHYLSQK